jgi:hypothetical protein
VLAKAWWGNMRERNYQVVDWRIILNWIFNNWDGGAWI